MVRLVFVGMFVFAVIGSVFSADKIYDDCSAVKDWGFALGKEFPGAKGAMKTGSFKGSKGVLIEYDFSGGGNYVASYVKKTLPEETGEISLETTVDSPVRISIRLQDQEGNWYQKDVQSVENGKKELVFRIDGKWKARWGKRKTGAAALPFKKMGIVISPPKGKKKTGASGKVLISKIKTD